MSGRLVHSLAVVTPTLTAALDDYGQPVEGDPVEVLVSGLLQPLSAREVLMASQAGVVVSTHRCWLPRSAVVSTAARIRREPDDGVRYEVTGVRDLDFGGLAHLEVDLRQVGSPDLEVVS